MIHVWNKQDSKSTIISQNRAATPPAYEESSQTLAKGMCYELRKQFINHVTVNIG
jgi:hypothetical protein